MSYGFLCHESVRKFHWNRLEISSMFGRAPGYSGRGDGLGVERLMKARSSWIGIAAVPRVRLAKGAGGELSGGGDQRLDRLRAHVEIQGGLPVRRIVGQDGHGSTRISDGLPVAVGVVGEGQGAVLGGAGGSTLFVRPDLLRRRLMKMATSAKKAISTVSAKKRFPRCS